MSALSSDAADSEQPIVSLVVAMASNRVIGRDNALPWRLPDDLKRFKRLTTGHTVVMGRKTYQSIGRPLPDRRNIVLTRDPTWQAEGVDTADGLERVLASAAPGQELFIIGGQQVYSAALPVADRIYLTLVHAEIEGDAFFPPIDPSQWRCVEQAEHPADERHTHAMTFQTLHRVRR